MQIRWIFITHFCSVWAIKFLNIYVVPFQIKREGWSYTLSENIIGAEKMRNNYVFCYPIIYSFNIGKAVLDFFLLLPINISLLKFIRLSLLVLCFFDCALLSHRSSNSWKGFNYIGSNTEKKQCTNVQNQYKN